MGDAISLVIEEIEHGLREQASEEAVGSLGALSHDDARVLGKVLAGYLNKYVHARDNRAVADAAEVLAEGFRLELTPALLSAPHVQDAFLKIGASDLSASCRMAAADVHAPVLWSHAVGDAWDTSRVATLLDVTRQAIHKRVRGGSLLGIPGEQTTWFPVWQFDVAQRTVRPETKAILAEFRDRLGADLDPLVIASSATTEQPDDLDGLSPAQWLEGTSIGSNQVELAARRAAARLAQ